MTVAETTLQENLNAAKQQFEGIAPANVVTEINTDIAHGAANNAVAQAVKEGQIAPNFTLPDVRGGNLTLADLLDRGPVVLTFYRGSWCPYCNLTVAAYQKALPQITELGATLVAVSPQTLDNALSLLEKHELAFPVLTDAGNTVARRYGLVFKLGDTLLAALRSLGVDIAQYNADPSGELPIPGTFIIGQDGIVVRAFVDPDFRKRLEPTEIIASLRGLTK